MTEPHQRYQIRNNNDRSVTVEDRQTDVSYTFGTMTFAIVYAIRLHNEALGIVADRILVQQPGLDAIMWQAAILTLYGNWQEDSEAHTASLALSWDRATLAETNKPIPTCSCAKDRVGVVEYPPDKNGVIPPATHLCRHQLAHILLHRWFRQLMPPETNT